MREIFFLISSLLLILLSAEVFTNGVESLGSRLSLSQAVVGSILAAVGTALPETILPLVAVFLHKGADAKKIGIGAILGAPFMLSTLAFFLVGLSVLISFFGKRRKFELRIEAGPMRRDLAFFLALYSTAVFLPVFVRTGRAYIAALLVAGYGLYAYKTFKGESADVLHAPELYFGRLVNSGLNIAERFGYSGLRPAADRPHASGVSLTLLQVVFALAVMVGGAHIFVGSLERLSLSWGINPLPFALLVAPVATELPEKFNSIAWTLKGKDTLALGNITGAMVFQSAFPVSVGLLFTDWNISGLGFLSAVIALASACIVLGEIHFRKRLSPLTVLLGGGGYIVYALAVIFR